MARPRKAISPIQVTELAKIGCSYAEMASVLNCDPSTLTRRFAQAIKEGRDDMHTSLRRWQYLAAKKGSTGMLIWLGKQHLGQTDKQEVSGDFRHEFNTTELTDEQLASIAGLVESATAGNAGRS